MNYTRVFMQNIVLSYNVYSLLIQAGIKENQLLKRNWLSKKDPAATYSSGASPLKYHRRMKA